MSAPVETEPAATPSTAPVSERTPGVDEDVRPDTPFVTVVWNDPVNLMSYVTYVFRKLFGFDEPKATALMLDVHEKGRAVVSAGTRAEMEGDVARLHAHGLWATVSPDR